LSLDNAVQHVGEYDAAHALAEQFAKDIADPVTVWEARGSRSGWRKVQALTVVNFRAKSQASGYPDTEIR
jgi:hypothetical protein